MLGLVREHRRLPGAAGPVCPAGGAVVNGQWPIRQRAWRQRAWRQRAWRQRAWQQRAWRQQRSALHLAAPR